MKRRRWWIGGLALALVAACVFAFVARPGEPPPCGFMRGRATVYHIEADGVGSGSSSIIYYFMAEPFEIVRDQAWVELGAPTDVNDNLWTWGLGSEELSISAVEDGLWAPNPPKKAKTVIAHVRPRATVADHIRKWFSRLR